MKIACSTVCFRHTSIDVAIDEVRRTGFGALDLAFIPAVCEHFDAARQSPAERQDFVALIARSGLAVPAITVAPAECDPAWRPFAFVHQPAAAFLKLAAQLSAGALNVICFAPSSDWVRALKDTAIEARQLGLDLNIGAQDNTLRLVEEIGEPNVRLMWDCSQAPPSPDAFRRLAPWIGHVRMREAAGLCVSFLEELAATGYSGWSTLEAESAEDLSRMPERVLALRRAI